MCPLTCFALSQKSTLWISQSQDTAARTRGEYFICFGPSLLCPLNAVFDMFQN